jgi:hypothetical protein
MHPKEVTAYPSPMRADLGISNTRTSLLMGLSFAIF